MRNPGSLEPDAREPRAHASALTRIGRGRQPATSASGAEVATDIHAQIDKALARRAQRESARIDVNVHDGVVRLTGTVDSLAEKRAACGVAWAAKGVRL